MTETVKNDVLERMLRFMVDKRASDLYLSANCPPTIRINGLCVPITSQSLGKDAPKDLLASMVSAEQMEGLATRHELSAVISLDGLGRFRVSAFVQRGTVALVIRFVPFGIPSLLDGQLPPVLQRLVMEKRGLVLMVGATGAGKSTTMASMIDHRNKNTSGHILTFEDPIEFLFQHKKSVVNQREIGSDALSVELAMKNAMHQAPDVIFIGEIRDQQTMSAALAFAQSGHLCLATLHANNSYHALTRILGFYPAQARESVRLDMSVALKAMQSQRLIRTASGQRLAACEVMMNTVRVAELIERGEFSDIPAAMEQSISQGSQSFEQDIARLIASGAINQQEGIAHADSPSNLMWRLQNSGDFSPPASSQALGAQAKSDTGPITLMLDS